MDEQFMWDFRTGCRNSAKFARFYVTGFIGGIINPLLLFVHGSAIPLNLSEYFKVLINELN